MAFGSHTNCGSQPLATLMLITVTKRIGYYDCPRLGKAVLADEEGGILFTRKRNIGLAKTNKNPHRSQVYGYKI